MYGKGTTRHVPAFLEVLLPLIEIVCLKENFAKNHHISLSVGFVEKNADLLPNPKMIKLVCSRTRIRETKRKLVE